MKCKARAARNRDQINDRDQDKANANDRDQDKARADRDAGRRQTVRGFVAETNAWLVQRNVSIEDVARVITEESGIEALKQFSLKLRAAHA